jgi:DNA-binding transcriptional MocR family regulator
MSDFVSTTPTYGVFARDALPERIAARLISLISDRQLRPGDKLPPERDLAATMQVSRPSLREALRALAMPSMIRLSQNFWKPGRCWNPASPRRPPPAQRTRN